MDVSNEFGGSFLGPKRRRRENTQTNISTLMFGRTVVLLISAADKGTKGRYVYLGMDYTLVQKLI